MNWATSEITVSTVITRSRSRRSATSDLTVLLRTGKDGAEPQKAPSHNSPRGRAPKIDATLGAFLLTTRDTPARKAGIVWALLAFLGGVLSDPAEILLWPDPDQWPALSWCIFNAEWGAAAHGHRPLWRPRMSWHPLGRAPAGALQPPWRRCRCPRCRRRRSGTAPTTGEHDKSDWLLTLLPSPHVTLHIDAPKEIWAVELSRSAASAGWELGVRWVVQEMAKPSRMTVWAVRDLECRWPAGDWSSLVIQSGHSMKATIPSSRSPPSADPSVHIHESRCSRDAGWRCTTACVTLADAVCLLPLAPLQVDEQRQQSIPHTLPEEGLRPATSPSLWDAPCESLVSAPTSTAAAPGTRRLPPFSWCWPALRSVAGCSATGPTWGGYLSLGLGGGEASLRCLSPGGTTARPRHTPAVSVRHASQCRRWQVPTGPRRRHDRHPARLSGHTARPSWSNRASGQQLGSRAWPEGDGDLTPAEVDSALRWAIRPNSGREGRERGSDELGRLSSYQLRHVTSATRATSRQIVLVSRILLTGLD